MWSTWACGGFPRVKSMGNTSRHVASGDVQASSCSTKAKSGKATRLLLNPLRIRPMSKKVCLTMGPTPALAAVPGDHQEGVPASSVKPSLVPSVTWASEMMRKSYCRRRRCAHHRFEACPAVLAMKKPWAFQAIPS